MKSLRKKRLFCCLGSHAEENDADEDDLFGICTICRECCTSRSCECSFFHEECMNDYNLVICLICNTTFNKTKLQPRPIMTKEEKQELKFFKTHHKKVQREKIKILGQHAYILIPGIKKLFRTKFSKDTDYKFIFQHVANDPSLCNSLYQRVLDLGHKEEEAQNVVSYTQTLGMSYDLDDPKIIKKIKTLFSS